MVELAQLFQDLDQIVQEQEPLVANIEQKGEEIHDNVKAANVEIDGAIVNRKKWWCLLVLLLIIIVIVVIAVVVTQVNKAAANTVA
jgi:syntaxin 1B/2/3